MIRIASYYLMPDHWHLLLWPRHDGKLSDILCWITVTHTQHWDAHHHTAPQPFLLFIRMLFDYGNHGS